MIKSKMIIKCKFCNVDTLHFILKSWFDELPISEKLMKETKELKSNLKKDQLIYLSNARDMWDLVCCSICGNLHAYINKRIEEKFSIYYKSYHDNDFD